MKEDAHIPILMSVKAPKLTTRKELTLDEIKTKGDKEASEAPRVDIDHVPEESESENERRRPHTNPDVCQSTTTHYKKRTNTG